MNLSQNQLGLNQLPFTDTQAALLWLMKEVTDNPHTREALNKPPVNADQASPAQNEHATEWDTNTAHHQTPASSPAPRRKCGGLHFIHTGTSDQPGAISHGKLIWKLERSIRGLGHAAVSSVSEHSRALIASVLSSSEVQLKSELPEQLRGNATIGLSALGGKLQLQGERRVHTALEPTGASAQAAVGQRPAWDLLEDIKIWFSGHDL